MTAHDPRNRPVPDPHARRHWLSQRITAIALVPLGLWFLFALLSLPDLGHASVGAWIANPLPAVLMLLFAWSALWHSSLGVQVVIEDYVPRRMQTRTLRVLQVLHGAAAISATYAVGLLVFGGAG